MDKIGHLVMTKSLSGNIHRAHKAALLFGSILPVFFLSFTSNTRRISIAFNKMLNAIPCQTVGICCIHVGTYVDNVDHETGEKYTKYGHAKSVT